jgi:hypothetical protein
MERICVECGRGFNCAPSIVRKGKGRFCSRACVRVAGADRIQPTPLVDRFWPKVKKTKGCWLWMSCRNRQGYGQINVGNKKRVEAHRVAYELTYGPIPDGKVVRHKCDNPRCCRPDHLLLGTYRDNAQDAIERGQMPSGERHGNAYLTAEKVNQIRNRVASGEKQIELADSFGVSKMTINDIIRGRTWRHA